MVVGASYVMVKDGHAAAGGGLELVGRAHRDCGCGGKRRLCA